MTDRLLRRGAAALSVLALAFLTYGFVAENINTPRPVIAPAPAVQPRAEAPGAAALRTASAAADAAADKHLAAIAKFFDGRAGNARAFAERATSLRSTWLYGLSRLGIEDADTHARFLRTEFEARLFSQGDIQSLLDRTVAEYRKDLERVDGQFVVDLRHDLPDSALLSPELVTRMQAADTFRAAYGRLLAEVGPALQREIGVTVAAELTTFYLGNVAAGGLLKVAAGAGLAVGGWVPAILLNIAAGALIERIVQWILDQVGYDPTAEAEAMARKATRDVRDRLVWGEPDIGARFNSAWTQQFEAPSELSRKKAAAEVDALAAGGKIGLARQLFLMRQARAVVRAEIVKKAAASSPGGAAGK